MPNRLGPGAIKPPSYLAASSKEQRSANIPDLLRTEGIRTNTESTAFKTLKNPPELADMTPQEVEMYRRLQVNTRHLLENTGSMSILRNKWLEKIQPVKPVELSDNMKNPLNWTIEEVAKFVSRIPNCANVDTIFAEHEIDGLAFLQLRQSDLTKRMGLSLGTAIKVSHRILFLREECNAKFIQYK